MDNFIRKILNFEDDINIVITGFRFVGNSLIVECEYKKIQPMHCSKCGSIMHIKDVYIRTVHHNVLLNGKTITIHYKQRTWACTSCRWRYTPSVSFVDRRKQYSTELASAVKKLKNLSLSVSSVAAEFGVSDTQLHNWFMQNVSVERLPLPEILSIDEVHTNFRNDCKYSLVLMDFSNQQIVDILPSRRQSYTQDYFLSIPLQERNEVRYIISDMYQPYIEYADRYFHNAVVAVDSFHVISWLIGKLNNYCTALQRKYRDDPKSDEYYLIKNHRYFLLKNESDITEIDLPSRADRHFGYPVPTYLMREKFFSVDPHLQPMHDLKERYIEFNNERFASDDQVRKELEKIIALYYDSHESIFTEFAALLTEKKEYIINSFSIGQKNGIRSRLSNGPMESYNVKVKSLRRLARGVENFEFFRLRLLFNDRAGAQLLDEPKEYREIKNQTNKKRGPYKHNKKKISKNCRKT